MPMPLFIKTQAGEYVAAARVIRFGFSLRSGGRETVTAYFGTDEAVLWEFAGTEQALDFSEPLRCRLILDALVAYMASRIASAVGVLDLADLVGKVLPAGEGTRFPSGGHDAEE